MKQQTTWTLQTNGAWLVAGLSWQYLPLRGRRSMRLRAKEAGVSHWAEILADDGQSQGTLLGTVNVTDRMDRKHSLASMALATIPALPQSCYAVFSLSPGKFWFVAVSDGMLSPLSDIVGDESVIRTATSHFLKISATPSEGWTVYAPSGFFPNWRLKRKPSLNWLALKLTFGVHICIEPIIRSYYGSGGLAQ
ncbi:type 4b pilus protein PilO2 [Edwardsiella tarda]|uniref:type 4b pilus protein PilO2 n=1 Tax=Edwardsiella tarda TaxID=636 RepID=UPI0023431280